MRILVLGGTVFLGRHFVEAGLQGGHSVTLFHRGIHGIDLFPAATHLLGDRDGNLDSLMDGEWDAVVDCCGYVPRIVRQSCKLLTDRVQRYLFVSTISVYADQSTPFQDESAPTAQLQTETEEITGETYGALKALCEQEVLAEYGARALIIRPGLIAGPFDPTNRFTYWADRFAKGGELIVPARSEQPLQIIDARDLAAFMLQAIEDELSGIFNATGPDTSSTFGDLFNQLTACWPHAKPVPFTHEQLAEQGILPWQELPLVLDGDGSGDGMMRVQIAKAIQAGLKCRPWTDTALDTHQWSASNPSEAPPRHGLPPEKEAKALGA